MSARYVDHPLKARDLAPNLVLDAISHQGKIALDDFRGRSPLLIGLFRGLHCAFRRRHVAAMAQLNPALREQGVQSLAVVNTPVERARLYFRYHPIPGVLAASDPVRALHRAFGLPEVATDAVMAILIDLPGKLPEPMGVFEMDEFLNRKEGYEITESDQQMTSNQEQLAGQFLIDRHGVVRWSFTEILEGGLQTLKAPNPEELMSAASKLA
ncbi:redoxin domain-containing protein [Sinorhizobium fredii]|uniref:Peroxiredoxin n=1 Tax=Rhizobium fredii TaxID=380 RepID=A0A2A6LR08_RHIFR|nr:redoxin domain-containing protein [Sinorhizobium fredii]PDT44720.1 peroxiredoxin [Sinorhizobium fredii]